MKKVEFRARRLNELLQDVSGHERTSRTIFFLVQFNNPGIVT